MKKSLNVHIFLLPVSKEQKYRQQNIEYESYLTRTNLILVITIPEDLTNVSTFLSTRYTTSNIPRSSSRIIPFFDTDLSTKYNP